LGPVCVGGVVPPLGGFQDPPFEIKDSKKLSEKKRRCLRKYIEENATYAVVMVDAPVIDQVNILQATMKGMHECLDTIVSHHSLDRILVDGTYFPIYTHPQTLEALPHECIKGGDNLYESIAAASILAKEHRDEYIRDLVSQNPSLEYYDISKNKGYGTKVHMNSLYEKGVTKWHRRSFEPCKSLICQRSSIQTTN